MSSNTTDNSVMQSDDLEDLQGLLEHRQIDTEQAINFIGDFAEHKLKLNLNSETLMDKVY